MNTMKAVVLHGITKSEDIHITDTEIPSVRPGWVLVKIKAFGINHSEQILRMGEIENDYIQKPVIPGIECVGLIEDPSDSGWNKGQKVCALMGGMGRSFNGSYAEYALLPEHHVFPIDTDLSWREMAAVPETYYTAWGSLFTGLQLKKEDTILIRGASCSLGYAAIQIAHVLGCKVVGTTHREQKMSHLKEKSCDIVILDTGTISDQVKDLHITKVLELVGCATLEDSMNCVEESGIVCMSGVLGGIFSFQNFNPISIIPNGVFLTGFHSNWPTAKDMSSIFSFLKKNALHPDIGAVYPFARIQQACADIDNHKVNGKIVIINEEDVTI